MILSVTKNLTPQISLISKIYCFVLGNSDASEKYKQKTYQALKALDIKNVQNIPIKKMNGIGPKFARIDLSSFTAFGIWIDEQFLNSCSNAEIKFNIYHEAAHYKCKHHQKILLTCMSLLTLLTMSSIKLNHYLNTKKSLYRYAILTTTSIISLIGSYLYILSNIVKEQEKEADIFAAKTLVNSGKSKIVEKYIQNLKNFNLPNQNNIWWYSNKEQIEYLENIKESHII